MVTMATVGIMGTVGTTDTMGSTACTVLSCHRVRGLGPVQGLVQGLGLGLSGTNDDGQILLHPLPRHHRHPRRGWGSLPRLPQGQ